MNKFCSRFGAYLQELVHYYFLVSFDFFFGSTDNGESIALAKEHGNFGEVLVRSYRKVVIFPC